MTEPANMPRGLDDKVNARLLFDSLQQLRKGNNPALKDLAEDVLAGRLNPRRIPESSAAIVELQRGLDKYQQWRASVSEEEFERLTKAAEAHVARLRAEMEQR